MCSARDLISKYKNNGHHNESWLVDTIRSICNVQEQPLQPHAFQFECTRKAAKHNHKLLKKSNTPYQI